MNPAFDRITIDPAVMNGQPCIRGIRLTVKRVVRAMAAYPDRAELKQEFPGVHEDAVRSASQVNSEDAPTTENRSACSWYCAHPHPISAAHLVQAGR